MKTKIFIAIALAVALGVPAYWYWSPYLALRSLQIAAQQGDAEIFNEFVDYPKVRDSLKGQFSAMFAKEMGGPSGASNPFAAIGSFVGMGLVNHLVDMMVRPEVVMMMMKSGQMGAPGDGKPESARKDTAVTATPADQGNKWVIDRKGASKVIAYSVDPAKPGEGDSKQLGLVLERVGWVEWKITELRVPQSVFP